MPRLRNVARTVMGAGIAAASMASAQPAHASPNKHPVQCDARGVCIVEAHHHQQPGTPASAPVRGHERCTAWGHRVPCYDSELGVFDQAMGCYFKVADPQPPGSSPIWEGHYPHGVVYVFVCPYVPGTNGGEVWRATPPAGALPSPGQLAQRAVARMRLGAPDIRLSPPVDRKQLVGLPTWMWTPVTRSTWATRRATAAVKGESVTATATATKIDWSMGDGHTVLCHGPGTPYSSRYGAHAASPTCGYTYSTPSSTQSGDDFPVTATTTWRITWVGGGQRGTLTLQRASTVRVVVQEAEAVNS